MLVHLNDMLLQARSGGYAVGLFNALLFGFLISAAEKYLA